MTFAKNRNNRLTDSQETFKIYKLTISNKLDIRPAKLYPLKEWVKSQQNRHICGCGCQKFVKVLERHRSQGIPKYIQGHHPMRMTEAIESYNNRGLYTVAQVAKELKIGQTTIRRYEGIEFPKAQERGANKARLFTKEQIQHIKQWRDKKWPNHKKFKDQSI